MMTQADLPAGWAEATIGQLCLVNPRSFANIIGDDCPISFVPMAAVEARTGRIDLSQVRQYGEVRYNRSHASVFKRRWTKMGIPGMNLLFEMSAKVLLRM